MALGKVMPPVKPSGSASSNRLPCNTPPAPAGSGRRCPGLGQKPIGDGTGQAAVAVLIGVESEKPEVGQVGAQQPIQLLFQLGSGRCFEVQALTADGAREHLHVLLRAGANGAA
jgi:hypothetical protein